MSVLARRYGASPLHLLAHLGLLALAAWAVGHVLDFRGARDWIVWFVGAALLHDLAFLPAYTVLDRLAGGARPARWVNHVRVPAVISGVLLLVWFPLVLGLSERDFEGVSGRELGAERLRDWLLVTGALFLASAVACAVRSRRGVEDLRRGRPGDGDAARRGVR